MCRVLKEIAEKNKASVKCTFCVMGIRNGVYTASLCTQETLEGYC